MGRREYVKLVRVPTDAERVDLRRNAHDKPRFPPHVVALLFFSTPEEEALAFAAIKKHPARGFCESAGSWRSLGGAYRVTDEGKALLDIVKAWKVAP